MNHVQPSLPNRLYGIDAARALAVAGMTMVHLGPTDAEGLAGWLYGVPHGRASVLFVFIAGIGVALLSREPERQMRARLRLIWVAAIFLPLGLALQRLDHGVAVILHHYGLFYLLAALVLNMDLRGLLTLAGVSSIVGPLGYVWLRSAHPKEVARATVEWGDGFGEILAGLLVTGPYPLLTWGAIIIAGICAGRTILASENAPWRLLLFGCVLTLGAELSSALVILALSGSSADWSFLVTTEGHSQSPLWLISAIGTAAIVVGAALLVERQARAVLWPLAALGQVALSFYVGHLVVLHYFAEQMRFSDVRHALPSSLLMVGIAMGIAVVWRRTFIRGPMEYLMVLPFDRRLRAGR